MIDLFDPIAYFEDRDIEYHTEGKNVSRGWVNIPCPFCDDPSWHCGINLESNLFHCWICGERGSVVKLIRQIEGCCSWTQAELILGRFLTGSDIGAYKGIGREEIVDSRVSDKGLWPELAQDLASIHRRYLQNRGFDPDRLIEKYHLRGCLGTGPYKFRIIVPVFLGGQMVSFVARDVTGKQEPKYLACPDNRGIIPLRQTLYNIDTVTNRVVIVEGITDVWRIGDGAVATLGQAFTQEQVRLLVGRGVRGALVLFDSDAEERARQLAAQLSGFLPTDIGLLDEGDPCDMDDESLREIRRWLKK
jgi:DNA primase